MSELRDDLIAVLEEPGKSHDIDIVDVSVSGSFKSPKVCVRIDYLDNDDNKIISLDDIAEANSWISNAIEDSSLINSSYMLEVSSPGMDRPLRRISDFQKFIGSEAVIKTQGEGRKSFTGVIKSVEMSTVKILCDGCEFEIEFESIQSAHIKPRFN